MPYTTLNVIKIPLSLETYKVAEIAYQQQSSPKKHIYLNTLAVQAVKQYFQWLSIPTDWQSCESFDPVIRQLMDVADIEVPGYGRLECRPVLPGENIMTIPSEVQGNRIGYIAVQFDEELETANLLGFTKTASQERILLEALEPLEILLDLVGTILADTKPSEDVPATLLNWQEPISLRNWLNDQFDDFIARGWQTLNAIEHCITPAAHTELAFQVRGAQAKKVNKDNLIQRGKLLNLEKGNEQVALVMGLQTIESSETEIWVAVYPTGEQTYLPSDLELIVLDETGNAVMQTQSRSSPQILMEFIGESGEQFSIKLAMGDFTLTEAFQL